MDVFDPTGTVVRCTYTDGTSQDFTSADLEFFANGNKIAKGYKFKVAGEKAYVIGLGNHEVRQTFTVVPTFKQQVLRYEMLKQPTQTRYRAGDVFPLSAYAVRCHFSDGSAQDYVGTSLDITANGVQMRENYAFTTPGNKKVVLALGTFKKEFNITVVK